MRNRLAALLVPLALSACATYGYPGGSDGGYYGREGRDRWDDSDTPLHARLVENGSGLGISLNRPAHVAIFEILPGAGVGLLYPGYSREAAYLSSGFSYVSGRTSRRYDWYNASYNHSGRRRNEPRFYLLVASRRPLRTERFHSGGSLRSALGLSSYSTGSYRSVMNDLVEAVVPYQHDDDWTTDVLAMWPDRRYDQYWDDGDRYTRVRCANGTVVLTPWELASYACGTRRTGGNGNVPPVRPKPDGDSTTVRKPGRRRPEVPTNGGSRPGTTQVEAPERRPRDARPGTRPLPEDRERPRVRPAEAGDEAREPEAREVPRTREQPRSEEPRREAPRVRETREERPAPAPRRESPPPAREEPRRSEPARTETRRADPPPRAEPRNDTPRNDTPRAERPSRTRDPQR